MNKLLGVSKQGNMWLVGENENQGKWYFLAPNVMPFAKNYKKGENVEITVEPKDGKNTITFIKKVDGSKSSTIVESTKSTSYSKPYTPSNETSSSFTCARCGAALKDGTYKTCYTCSMAIKKEEESSPEGISKQDSIKRQAIGNMTSRSLIGLQGFLTPDNILEIITKVYKHYEGLVN